MGQIIFPTTLDWSLGSFFQAAQVSQYLRLEFLNETYGARHTALNGDYNAVIYNGLPCWDLSTVTSWYKLVRSQDATVIIYALWDGVSLGGGFGVWDNYDNRIEASAVRTDSSFISDVIDDYTPIAGFGDQYNSYFMKIWAMTPYRADYRGEGGKDNFINNTYFSLRYCYVIAVDALSCNYNLYDDVLNMRFKPTGYWLSPIIDMGPYIHVTSLSVTNYSVPAGGSVKIYFRASGSAPTTGSPTAFEDTSGNTLYYYGPNETWSASDWEEVPSGSEPSYKDRYIQMKLELNGA